MLAGEAVLSCSILLRGYPVVLAPGGSGVFRLYFFQWASARFFGYVSWSTCLAAFTRGLMPARQGRLLDNLPLQFCQTFFDIFDQNLHHLCADAFPDVAAQLAQSK
jgi:hypothetical protein